MAGPCQTGPCLPGAGSGWFLLLLAAVWSVVLIEVVLLLLVRRGERRPARSAGRRSALDPRSAVTVNEIRVRLADERAAARRAGSVMRKVTVVPRQISTACPPVVLGTDPIRPLREDGNVDE